MTKEKRLKDLNNKILEIYKDREIVLGDGRVESSIVLIGEAPGRKEVENKRPFVGQAGRHLQDFLALLGIKREEVYITNTVKFRPTRVSARTRGEVNRAPDKKEIKEFRQYLFKELDIIRPEIIVTLGNVPLKAVTGDEHVKVGELHGKKITANINGRTCNVFSLYHPAAVIYRRELKKTYNNDLIALRELIKSTQSAIDL